MAEREAKITVSAKQPAPKIRREIVDAPEIHDGQPTGGTIKVERVLGTFEYRTGEIPPGTRITLDLKADGKVIGTLGPWIAVALPGRAATAQGRLVVSDDSEAGSVKG